MGYTIQKGKLSLDLQYLIVKQKLESENRVFLDQLTLGDQVESPEATKLPVKLAIALLKNRKGEIKLNLPVTGNVDDPQFSVGGVILKILKNILVKAATSPFALLGAILGGGEEISFLEFEYGSSAIPPTGEKKLSQLSKVLYERPSLKMEIEGHADIEQDKEELRNIFFHRKVKAQKLKDIVKQGNSAITVDEVVVGPEEYPKYLKRAYKREKFPKPRNFLGIAKSLPVPEMEKLMFTHIEVTTDDLRLLALQRAQSVQDYLLKTGKVEANRLFLIEPNTLQPGKKEKGKDSRVNFRIK
jgi:outer membrane protein OmpA-like peptidoglycan-associated protein